MKKMFLRLSAAAGLLVALSFSATAEEKKENKEVTLQGEGMCARCELKETSSCQNAIQVNYFLEQNDASKAFHKNVCQGVKKDVSAAGTLKEKDGKKIFVAREVKVGQLKGEGDEKVLKGEGMCGKCELGVTDSCQNVVRVTYYLEKNDVSNGFHSNVCRSTAKVKATGTIKDQDGKKVFTAKKIELDK